MHFSKPIECITPRVNVNVISGPCVIMMCKYRFIGCKKWSTLLWDVDSEWGCMSVRAGLYGKSLYFPPNSAININCSKKSILKKHTKKIFEQIYIQSWLKTRQNKEKLTNTFLKSPPKASITLNIEVLEILKLNLLWRHCHNSITLFWNWKLMAVIVL